MKKNIFILTVSLLSNQAFAVQEIPDANINDIAITTIENNETIIRYNPEYCESMGEQVCDFFLSHEYGHISLGHPIGGEYTLEEEYAADCWVTQHAPEDLSKATYAYLVNGGNMGSWDYSSTTERAENISQCPNMSVFKNTEINSKSANQKQTKSRFNHYRADAVYADIERIYPQFFPRSSNKYGREGLIDGYVAYLKAYRTGSALMEYRGVLFYTVPSLGIDWTAWGPISNWRI